MHSGQEIGNMIYSRRLSNIPEEIKALPYFFPQFNDSTLATEYLEQHDHGSGSFLLRLSSKGDNYLSVSVSIANKSVRHVNVQIQRGPPLTYYIVKELMFSSFGELHKHYMEHRICNLEQIENVRLVHPLQNPSPFSLSNGSPISDIGAVPSTATRRKDSASRPLPSPPSDGERPPCPPPVSGESNVYYSHVRDTNKNRIDELQQTLKNTEKREKCDCGIPISDSILPEGWSLHKSHDSTTFGCLFYQSAQGDTTWDLPNEIVPHITKSQRNIIVNLSHQSGKSAPMVLYEQGGGGDRGGGGGVHGPARRVGGGVRVGGGTSPDVVPQMNGIQGQNSRRPRGQELASSMNMTRQDPNRL